MTNSIKMVTGHEAEMVTVTDETAAIKAEWDALTDDERKERIARGHAEFDAAMTAQGSVPFWE